MEKHFDKACADIKTHGKNLSNDQLLKLYGLYKQATVGDCNTDKPGMLDLKGKSQNDAKKEYVEYVLTLLPDDVKKGYQ